jgi:hypothetical protein
MATKTTFADLLKKYNVKNIQQHWIQDAFKALKKVEPEASIYREDFPWILQRRFSLDYRRRMGKATRG